MLVYEKEAHNYYCPFCFATEKEDTMRCQGSKCMLWIYIDEEIGSCALCTRDEQKYSLLGSVSTK
jgi:hypothetical protein